MGHRHTAHLNDCPLTSTAEEATRRLPFRSAILLAAGLATRMGHRPKALLERDGIPLIRRGAQALIASGAQEVVVVLGTQATAMQAALEGLQVKTVLNPQPERGQGHSLAYGLKALAAQDATQGLMIALADLPLIETADLNRLWQAYAMRPQGIDLVQPRHAQQLGNPVVISPRLQQEWRLASGPILGQDWKKKHPHRVHHWDTPEVAYFFDLDAPEDLQRLHREHGVSLKWPQNR